MKVAELHAHLTAYLAQSPLNAAAEVVLQGNGGVRVLGGANDARGMLPGEHLLILLPVGEPLGIREFTRQ